MSEASAEIIAKTQKSLGKYVKKPVLTEKLLKKPPFRFLHDVIKAVIKDTGFLNGLFSDDELNSENVKEKEAKVAFLTKLIDAVKTVSKTDLKVRPSKIVAGLESSETNLLLQTIAKSIDRKIDTKDYVSKLKSGEVAVKDTSNKNNKSGKEQEKKANLSKTRDSSVNKVKKSEIIETPKSTNRLRESSRSKGKEEKKEKSSKTKDKNGDGSNRQESKHVGKDEKKSDKVIKINNEQNVENHEKIATNSSNVGTSELEMKVISEPVLNDTTENTLDKENTDEQTKPDDNTVNFSNVRQGSAGLVRPKSARPKSGDRVSSSRTRGGDLEPDGMAQMKVAIPARPSSSLRPPSVRPSSARPGAPRLRPDSALPISEPVAMGNINVIVENFDSGLGDDEDTVVIQNAPEVAEDDGIQASDLLNISRDNKGQLVEQILEQIQEGQEDGGIRKKVEIDWEQDGLRGKDATTKEVTQLRSLIQSLTKTANPLGKLMNYLHEDLDAMHNELQMWTSTKKQLYTEIEKQKKLSVEFSKPLLDKLDHLRQEIKKQEQEILTVRSNILRNEQRISELLGNK